MPLERSATGLGSADASIALVCGEVDRLLPDSGWDRAGHVHLSRAARAAERDGAPLGLFDGVAGLGFAAQRLAAGRTRYGASLTAIDDAIAGGVAASRTMLARTNGLPVRAWDLISGITGIGAYLLGRRATPAPRAALEETPRRACRSHARDRRGTTLGDAARAPSQGHARGRAGRESELRGRTRGTRVAGADVARADRGRGGRRAGRRDPTDGRLGGAPSVGPAASVPNGPPRFRSARRHTRTGSRLPAPGGATGTPESPAPSGWPATPWTIQSSPDWPSGPCERGSISSEREQPLHAATLCHGTAGLTQVTLRMAADSGAEDLSREARMLCLELVERFDPEAPFGYHAEGRLRDLREAEIDATLLDGAAGPALVLLAAATEMDPGWDRALLLS